MAANAYPPQILQQYLELRANGLDDFGAQAAIARDRGLGEDELVERLRLEASAVQAAGSQGLEPFLAMWPPHSSPPRPWTPRGSAGTPSAALPGWAPISNTPGRGSSPDSYEPPAPWPGRGQRLLVQPRGAGLVPQSHPSAGAGLFNGLLRSTLNSDRRGGAGPYDGPPEHIWERMAQTIAEQAGDVAALAKSQIDDRKSARGTVKALGRDEEELVLLARGCDRHYVAVCPQVLGRHLYTALKDAAIGAGGALREVGWNVPMRTRTALGFAGGYWGGRTAAQAEGYALTAGDFPAATTQELDEFMVPSGDTPEARPRPPATWDDWLRRVRRIVNLWVLVYGEEWRAVMAQCTADLERLHEEHPTTFPREVIKDIWEELCWRFWEELRETLRALRQAAGRDNLRKTELIA